MRAQSVIRSARSEAEHSLNFPRPRPRPGDSASFCALNPMVTTIRAGGHAGGAFRGGLGGPPGKAQRAQNSAIR
eukprot:797995-Alexandrium_andersonii.AAC.1